MRRAFLEFPRLSSRDSLLENSLQALRGEVSWFLKATEKRFLSSSVRGRPNLSNWVMYWNGFIATGSLFGEFSQEEERVAFCLDVH